MRTAKRSCTSYCRQEDLWDYLADYDNVVKMASAGGVSRLVSGDRRALHAVHRATLDWEGMNSTYEAKLAEASRPESLAWAGKSAGIGLQVRFLLAPLDPTTTRVTAELTLAMTRATLPLEPFAWGMIAGLFDRLLQQIESLELP